jgi:hypothetical protein
LFDVISSHSQFRNVGGPVRYALQPFVHFDVLLVDLFILIFSLNIIDDLKLFLPFGQEIDRKPSGIQS